MQTRYLSLFLTAALTLSACQAVLTQPEGYKFEQVGSSADTEDGLAVTVRLVRSDETPVPDARLYAEQWVYVRRSPVRRDLVAMKPDGRGNFTFASNMLHAGDAISLAARLAPDAPLLRGVIEVH